MAVWVKAKAAIATSAAGNRWNEDHGIAVRQRRRPVAEFVVDGYPQHRRGERERVALCQLGVQLRRGGGAGRERLRAPPRLLAQQCVVLHGDLLRRAYLAHDRAVLRRRIDVVERARIGLGQEQRIALREELARTVPAA